MGAINKGEAFIFGISGTITGCAVQSVTRKRSFANVSEVVNEQGNRVTKRYDDISDELTIEVIPKTDYSPGIGDTLSYGGVAYTIESIDDKREAKGFARYTLTCVKTEYIG